MAHSAPDTTKKRGKHPNEPPEQLEFPTVFRTADGPHEPGAGQRSNPVRPSSTRSREEPSSEPFMTWAPQKKVGRVTPAGIGGGGGKPQPYPLCPTRPRPWTRSTKARSHRQFGAHLCQWAERPREAEPNPGEYTGVSSPTSRHQLHFPFRFETRKPITPLSLPLARLGSARRPSLSQITSKRAPAPAPAPTPL